MSENNWDGYRHQTLYDQIHGRAGFVDETFLGGEDGAGVAGAAGAQDGWADLAAVMESARERTEAALRRAGVEWEGSAFDSMTAGVTPLAQWADDANTAGTASQSSVDTHVGAYEAARNTMPEPVEVTSTANSDAGGIPAAFTRLFGGQTDQDRQEAAAQEAKAEAVRVMSGFDSESTTATGGVGRFVPPPSVTVTVASTQPVGSDIPDSGQYGPNGDGPRTTADGGGTRPPTGGPSGGGTPAPAPGHTNPSGLTPPGTTPAGSPPLTTSPPTTSPLLPGQSSVGQPNPALVGPLAATGGRPDGTGRGAGSGFGGGAGRGAGGPGAGGPGAPGGARGALPGSGPISEPIAGRGAAGATPTGRAGGMGMAPMGAGRAQDDEDKEHYAAEYLRSTNDGFWDNTDPVAPPVIGEDDE